MKKYEQYKDSGVQWIGEIPSHWKSLKMKNIFNVIAGATPDSNNQEFWDGDIAWVTPADYKSFDHYLSSGKRFITKQGYDSCATTLVPAGSIIFSKRAPIGSVILAKNELCTNQGCLSCVPTNKACSDFYYYALCVFTDALELFGAGSTFKEISAFDFSNFRIPYPSLEEQRVIAAYLDHKVGQIDALIAEKEAMVSDLTAYRSAVISEAVTRGLDKSARMRDSGIDWIGQIPEHWSVVKLSWMYPNIGSGTTPDTSNPEYYSENGINWLQTGDLNDGEIVETSKHITEKAIQERGLKIYPAGILVVAMYGATIGKVGILKIDTTTNQACCVLPPNEQMSNLYMKFVLQAAKEVLLQNSVGGGQPNISQAIIKALNIPLPAIKEQEEIAAYIQKKYIEMDTTLAELQAEIADLQSFKSAIITEAVTGKVDLRDWKPKTVTA